MGNVPATAQVSSSSSSSSTHPHDLDAAAASSVNPTPLLEESHSNMQRQEEEEAEEEEEGEEEAETGPTLTPTSVQEAPRPALHRSSVSIESSAESFWADSEDDEHYQDNDVHVVDDDDNRRRRRRRVSPRRLARRLCRVCLYPLTDQTGSKHHILLGLGVIFFWGCLLGVLLPASLHTSSSSVSQSNVVTRLYQSYGSGILGYTYFMAWSISFYPQVVLNVRRRTTVGLSLDFCAWNVLGFACYALYTTLLYWHEPLRRQYREWHDGNDVSVQSNDVAFALHAWLLSSITLAQVWYYDYGLPRRSTVVVPPPPVSPLLRFGFTTVVTALGAVALVILCWKATSTKWWLQYLYGLSAVKVMISIIKYIPQVMLNYRRRSTVGWNIWNIVLDFTGGMLSLAQLMGDAALVTHDWSAITGNLAKFGLGFVSIGFDMIFMLQHYVLYAEHPTSNHRHSLLVHANTVPAQDGDDAAAGIARSMSV